MTRQDAVSNLASLAKSWGIGTVLLCVAAYWVSKKADYLTEVGIPAHLKQIQQGYEEIQVRYEKSLEKQQTSFERSLESLIKANDRERELWKQQIDRALTGQPGKVNGT